MKGWETIKVKQCFKFRNGKSFNGILKEKADNEYCYPVYGGNGVIGYCKTPLLKEPTLIVGRVGEYCGNVFKTQSESWVTDNAMLVNEILLKDFNIDFWAIKLNSLQFNHYSDSTGQPKVTQGGIGAISFTYPINNEEQTAIANILSKVDETIAAVQNSIDSAERLKKSLMQNLLTGKMKPDGTFRTPDEFYIDEKFGKVPVGWEVKKLKEVCTNTGEYGANASAIPFNGLTPRYIRITDIDDFGNLIDEDKATIDAENYDKYLLQDDDFLFARTGDTVGKSLLYKRAQMGMAVYAGYLIKYTFDKEKIIPEYFNVIAQSEFFERFKVAMKRIGAKPNINSGEYSSFKFLLPKTTQEQLAILSRFNDVDTIISKNNSKLIVLGKLKKSLMQNLLTGKVRVIY
ncbi:MAG: restriction endonuclease subunit S [Paludibacteraceae bacterium]|nr:restriction endonuclease subunit S [Paludibacteraceae bacterium]